MNPEVHVPGWEWYYVAMYFYIGGVSAGTYFVGSLAELFGSEKHREVSRIAFYLAFPLILLTPPLLIADLGRPERFWHLLINANTGLPYFNLESPLSVGSWALLLYGAMALLSFLDNLVADGIFRAAPVARLYTRFPRKVYALVGSATGFFVAGYTGVVLNITARPFWAATDPLMGALFIASAASTGAAAISLVFAVRNMLPHLHLGAFERFDRLAMGLELVLALGVVILAGKFAAPLMHGSYAVMFWGGAVLAGMLIPLAASWYLNRSGTGEPLPAELVVLLSMLVLVGGALLRISLVQAGQV